MEFDSNNIERPEFNTLERSIPIDIWGNINGVQSVDVWNNDLMEVQQKKSFDHLYQFARWRDVFNSIILPSPAYFLRESKKTGQYFCDADKMCEKIWSSQRDFITSVFISSTFPEKEIKGKLNKILSQFQIIITYFIKQDNEKTTTTTSLASSNVTFRNWLFSSYFTSKLSQIEKPSYILSILFIQQLDQLVNFDQQLNELRVIQKNTDDILKNRGDDVLKEILLGIPPTPRKIDDVVDLTKEDDSLPPKSKASVIIVIPDDDIPIIRETRNVPEIKIAPNINEVNNNKYVKPKESVPSIETDSFDSFPIETHLWDSDLIAKYRIISKKQIEEMEKEKERQKQFAREHRNLFRKH